MGLALLGSTGLSLMAALFGLQVSIYGYSKEPVREIEDLDILLA